MKRSFNSTFRVSRKRNWIVSLSLRSESINSVRNNWKRYVRTGNGDFQLMNVHRNDSVFACFVGAEWKPVNSQEREARVVVKAEGELPTLPSRGGGQLAAQTETVFRTGMSQVQTEDPDRSPQHWTGFSTRGGSTNSICVSVEQLLSKCSFPKILFPMHLLRSWTNVRSRRIWNMPCCSGTTNLCKSWSSANSTTSKRRGPSLSACSTRLSSPTSRNTTRGESGNSDASTPWRFANSPRA